MGREKSRPYEKKYYFYSLLRMVGEGARRADEVTLVFRYPRNSSTALHDLDDVIYVTLLLQFV